MILIINTIRLGAALSVLMRECSWNKSAQVLQPMQRTRKRGESTSWFKLNDPNVVSHECRLQYVLECHIFGTYHTDRHEQRKRWHSHFF